VAHGLSLRANFVWVLSGNVVYAACQLGMIVALAKLGTSLMVGQFSLGLAVASPVIMFTNLHLRAVQATDAKRSHSFHEYIQLRIVMTAIALAIISGIACFENYGRKTTMIVLAVALAKGIESLSDIYYGLFQLNDRLDQTGSSMMLRGTFSMVALIAGLYFTGDVFWGCVGLALVWLAALFLFDLRRGRRFLQSEERFGRLSVWRFWRQPERRAYGFRRQVALMQLALPLGVVTTLASLNLNMPRYFIEARMGEHQLGIFSALAYGTVVITIVGDALGHCAIPRLSRLYAAARLAEFRAALLRLSTVGGLLGLTGLAIAQVIGAQLLRIFYSPEYADSSKVFVLLMLATAIHCVAGMLTSGILSARRFSIQVPIFALTAASTAFACSVWVPMLGLIGGAFAMIAGAVVRLILSTAIAGYLFFLKNQGSVEHPALHTREADWTAGI
jgi:O-antigen/teichoic acid export membrane protein